jgi:predicted acetyltransferase
VRTLRPVTAEELPGYLAQAGLAFNSEPVPRELLEARSAAVERERTLAVFEDGAMVGTAGIESMLLGVPGGRLPAAGIGRITVAPTHRRRGILTDIMRRQLLDVRERGEAVAALFASEGAIYGRFGFGVATYESHLRIARHRNAFRVATDLAGLRMVTLAEVMETVLALVDRTVETQPGAVRRSDAIFRYYVRAAQAPGGGEAQVVVRAERDGFVVYERDVHLSIPSLDGGSLRVIWLVADNPEAYAALWRYCLDHDLVDEVVAPARSVDEPLRHLLADPRALETRVWDGLWLRLVDVERALAARAYAAGGSVRLAVEDAFCPWNAGTYEVGGEGIRRVAAEPDLVLGAEALAACYLGGSRFATLARAGRVEERRPGAAALADGLFAAPRAPWSPFRF